MVLRIMVKDPKKTIMKELARRELARRDFPTFCQGVWSNFQMTKHLGVVASALKFAYDGDLRFRRVVVHMPPQHGKTLMITKLFPAWLLGNKPGTNIITTAYNDEHATGFGREIRNIINSPAYQLIFPGITIAADSKAAGRWSLGGENKGGVLSSGIFGGITGNPANWMFIDDPYKNLEEAENPEYRKKVEDAWKTVLSTRLHHNSVVWVVQTRWNEDDLAGFLMRQTGQHWHYLKLPALAQHNDPAGRRPLSPLWPWRANTGDLIVQRENLGSYLWNAMYQGDPAPLAGLLFKREHFRIIRPDQVPQHLHWWRYWDIAATEDKKADPTASVAGAYTEDGYLILRDGVWGRWEWPVVRSLIKATALNERGCRVGIEAQGMQKGMTQEAYRDPELRSVGIWGFKVSRSKRIRAYPLVARGEAGKILLVDGPWVEAFLKEMIQFDNAPHDDWVDAASGVNFALGIMHGFNDPEAAAKAAASEGNDGEEGQVIQTWYGEDEKTHEVMSSNDPTKTYSQELEEAARLIADQGKLDTLPPAGGSGDSPWWSYDEEAAVSN